MPSEVSVVAAMAIGGAGLLIAVGSVVWAQFQLRAARRSFEETTRMKTEFVSTISHELRTPLTSIAGFAEALQQTWGSLGSSEITEFLDIMTREAEHLSTLVEDILVLPRLDAGRLEVNPEIMDLSALAAELVESVFAPGHYREVDLNVPTGVKVFADPKRAGQVIRNLLANAMHHGGREIAIEGSYSGTHYLLVVSDNGKGIAADRREVVFDQFVQGRDGSGSNANGAGLGLPIARRLARQMGGELWCEARFPTGVRFCVTFPLSDNGEGHEIGPKEMLSAANPERFSWR
jgi:signal transduction histidine kinase